MAYSHYPSRFISLPREIRDEIYFHAFTNKYRTTSVSGHSDWVYKKPPAAALVLANRQIHAESNAALYGVNKIFLFSPSTAVGFFHRIGDANVALLRRLLLKASAEHAAWAKVLKDERLIGIRELELNGVRDRHNATPWPNMVSDELVASIYQLFERNQDQRFTPSLRLLGFARSERTKFPPTWNVHISQL